MKTHKIGSPIAMSKEPPLDPPEDENEDVDLVVEEYIGEIAQLQWHNTHTFKQ